MCDFPTVEKCCGFCEVGTAVIFISILSIATGSLFMSLLAKTQDTNLSKVMATVTNDTQTDQFKNVTIWEANKVAMSKVRNFVLLGLLIESLLFMLAGAMMLISILGGELQLIQFFTIAITLNIVIAALCVLVTIPACLLGGSCPFPDNLDWLNISFYIVVFLVFHVYWIYLSIVAHSHMATAGSA